MLFRSGQFKGGIGTASITLKNISSDGPVVVGAIAVVNALGLPFVVPPGNPEPSARSVVPPLDARFRVPDSPAAEAAQDTPPAEPDAPPALNTTLVVVATNAVLDKAECKRTASAAHAGLARALNPSHTLADGDTVFVLATGAVPLDRSTDTARQLSLITLQSAAADVVRLAILDGIAAAAEAETPAGRFRAYRDGVR